jgi:hypothetical protein
MHLNPCPCCHSCHHHPTYKQLQEVIEAQIYPPLSAGFSDENAYIRELTLKSLLTLAPKMKQATLTSNLLKHLSRLQVGVLGQCWIRNLQGSTVVISRLVCTGPEITHSSGQCWCALDARVR